MSQFDHITWFRASSPYINSYRGKTFVIYLPGEAVLHPNFYTIIQDLTLLHSLGIRLVIVHGARPQINERLQREGIESPFVNEQRITDEAALPLVLQAVGETRFYVEAALSTGMPNSPMYNAEIRVASGNYVVGMPKGVIDGVDFHFTGKVRKIEAESIEAALNARAVVITSPIGFSATGELFNVSSLDVATRVATALNADKLIVFVEPDGLYMEDGELLRQVSVSECRYYLNDASIAASDASSALKACYQACNQGVPRAQIVSYIEDGALIEELFTRDGSGTLVHSDSYEVVRRATIDDVGGILALIAPLEEQGILVRRSRELLEAEINRFYVLEIDGMIIGCCGLYGYGESDMAEVAAVATHPGFQGKGLGAKLMGYVEQQARSQGYTSLFVLTTQTAHWFIEHGFRAAELTQLPAQKQSLYNLQRRSKVFIKPLTNG
ncbi:amino-acid N-acetyltransferase [Halioxenophilus sp. WMMB6]|uniref:amino-acid N-acetyltransferase n=1 Tax=Halioxenophilus sp. WMMB6 TaxID=3073815 RepID=UPI00295EB30A|nr:amino-acid N-acetyltransferase [Halioxenophilus sp. WMMB6]